MARAEALTTFKQLVAKFPDRPEFRKELDDAEAQNLDPPEGSTNSSS